MILSVTSLATVPINSEPIGVAASAANVPPGLKLPDAIFPNAVAVTATFDALSNPLAAIFANPLNALPSKKLPAVFANVFVTV